MNRDKLSINRQNTENWPISGTYAVGLQKPASTRESKPKEVPSIGLVGLRGLIPLYAQKLQMQYLYNGLKKSSNSYNSSDESPQTFEVLRLPDILSPTPILPISNLGGAVSQ